MSASADTEDDGLIRLLIRKINILEETLREPSNASLNQFENAKNDQIVFTKSSDIEKESNHFMIDISENSSQASTSFGTEISFDAENQLEYSKTSCYLNTVADELFLNEDEENIDVDYECINFLNEINFEEGDSSIKKNQIERYMKRNVEFNIVYACDLAGNKDCIDDFRKYLVENGARESIVCTSIRLLFQTEDSFLRFSLKNNPNFSLNLLLEFSNEKNYLPLESPLSWLDSISGEKGDENPLRRKQMLKCYLRWWRFVTNRLQNVKIGKDINEKQRIREISSNLQEIRNKVDSLQLWDKMEKLIQAKKRMEMNASEILDQHCFCKEQIANQKYFSSDQFKAREAKVRKIWDNAFNKTPENLKPYELNDVGNFAKQLLSIYDRNRPAVYNFKIGHWNSRSAVWFPEGTTENENIGLSENAYLKQKPKDGRNPDAFTITMELPGLKMSGFEIIKVNKYCNLWLERFWDLRVLRFGDKPGNIYV